MNVQCLRESIRSRISVLHSGGLDRQRVALALFLFALLLTLGAGTAPIAVRSARSRRPPSGFNNDGRADLVIGVPFEDTAQTDEGVVQMLRGSSSGLTSSLDQMLAQETVGSITHAEDFDNFGYVLASGDFNGDGYADLAVGLPHEDIGVNNVGGVQIWYGATTGITTAGNQFWSQGADGIQGDPEADDEFGHALAVGDFNRDGYEDLAIGVPFEDWDGHPDAGVVNILYGSAAGIAAVGNQLLTQDVLGSVTSSEDNDRFGQSLATGDFNHDGFSDLAVGIPHENPSGVVDAGAVQVWYGSANRITATGNQLWSQATPNIDCGPEANDLFGWALAAGDFNGDHYDDLAVGVIYEDDGTVSNAGALNIIYGSATGLTSAGDQCFTQGSFGLTSEADDEFGYVLATGDFNHDGYGDLAVGIPYEDLQGSTILDAGGVLVVYGSAGGLTGTGVQFWNQDITIDTADVLDVAEAEDEFGFSLAAGDFDGDRYDDLAIGVPYEHVGAINNAGAVNVLYGSRLGLSVIDNQFWTQDSDGVLDAAEASDVFGYALVAAQAPVYDTFLPLVLR